MFDTTKAKSDPGPDRFPGFTIPIRSTECGVYIVDGCDEEIASNTGIAEIDSRTTIPADQLKRQRAGSPTDAIQVSTPATVATMAAAIGASSFTVTTTSAVTIEGISRR